jgi:hypothetical protein
MPTFQELQDLWRAVRPYSWWPVVTFILEYIVSRFSKRIGQKWKITFWHYATVFLFALLIPFSLAWIEEHRNFKNMESEKNRIQNIEPPKLVGLRMTQKIVQSNNQSYPYVKEIIIQTDKDIHPVKMLLTFDGEVEFVRAFPADPRGVMLIRPGEGLSSDKKQYYFSWDEPPFTPIMNISATVYSKKEVSPLKVEIMP